MPDPAKAEGPLTDEYLNQLPSYKHFYKKFKETHATCDDTSFKREVKDALDTYSPLSAYEGKILSAYCTKPNGKPPDPLNGEWCKFLYYWIGDLLFRNEEDDSIVATALSLICWNMKTTYREGGRELICETTEKELFNNRKTIFDYWHDYSVIQKLLENSKSECKGKYSDYLKGIVTAYEAINTNCTNPENKNNPYCVEFTQKFNGVSNNIPKPSELTCASSQEEGHVTHQADTPTYPGSSNITTAISSTLPIVGLPTLAFLLYKYTSLPFWLRNQFGNNNNSGGRNTRKRSAGPNISTFTEDDSSIEVSTLYESTEASTSDLTENSSLYTSPSSIIIRKGKGTNNRHGRNIRYQAM